MQIKEIELLKGWSPIRSDESYVFEGFTINNKTSGIITNKTADLKKPINLLRYIHRLCSARVKSMLGANALPITFTKDDNSTNGRYLHISTQVINEDLPIETKVEVMLGTTTHEVAHMLHTDFSLKYVINPLQGDILNILEDERIEFLECVKRPGFSKDFAATKKFYFDFLYKKEEVDENIRDCYDIFFKLIRYPKYVNPEVVNYYSDVLEQIRDAITPYPLTFLDTFKASVKIDEIFRKYFTVVTKPVNRNSGLLTGTGAGSSSNFEAKVLKELSCDNLDYIHNKLDYDEYSKSYIEFVSDEQNKYRDVLSGISRFSFNLKVGLNSKTNHRPVTIYNTTGQHIAMGSLVEGYLGSRNIYKEEKIVQKNSFAIVLILDLSGSMSGPNIDLSQQIAIALKESLIHSKSASLFIYGYSSDVDENGTNLIKVFYEPGHTKRFSLGNITTQGCNRDGVCLEAIFKRVRSFTKGKILAIPISDGSPSASNYSGEYALNHTSSIVRKYSQEGFYIHQIGIQCNQDDQKRMYSNFSNIENIKDLPVLFKNVLLSNSKKLTTMKVR